MKLVLMGNAGAGKTTLSRKLAAGRDIPCLSLDQVAFTAGVHRRPLADSIKAVLDFIAANDNWIIEGCYADIIEPILAHCETLVFLNPGLHACIDHCRKRPWEPEKIRFASRAGAESGKLDRLGVCVRTTKGRIWLATTPAFV
ncbi:hypothetical protein [Marinobacter sp. X15-166B]|uniref:hypothetical protein n=1 Tax=Marinobacter sp. X15-166B TaxID=1897620 RepID=UPI0018E9C5F0|nr:hypothetical protein [Marinobacter sp. X15-166B]